MKVSQEKDGIKGEIKPVKSILKVMKRIREDSNENVEKGTKKVRFDD